MITKPLGPTRADQRRFVDRARETAALLRAVQDGENALVLGDPGSGRTSLLAHVAWKLGRAADPREVVLVSGEVAGDAGQLLGVLVARVARLAAPRDGRNGTPLGWLEALRARSMPDGPFGAVVQPAVLMELVDLLAEQLAGLARPVCLMVDGAGPAVAHRLFGSLRNELWALPGAAWVLSGDLAAQARYREPPADAFFERVVRLEPLDDADAAKLLRAHGAELTEAGLAGAVAAGAGNPRRLLRAAREIAAGAAPSGPVLDALAAEAAEMAGPLAGALVAYLGSHGPAAASDATLLHELGASRQRASQLMHQLESAGLLESVNGHEPGRRGRPSRRFALREAA